MLHPKFVKAPLCQWGWLAWAVPAVLGALGSERANDSREENAESTNAFNAQQAAISREFSSQEAEKNRAFQEQMSNSAMVRGVQDMKNAGLNPMLAYSQGGASTPSGAMPSSAQAAGVTPEVEDSIGKGISTALAFRQQQAQIQNVEAQTDLTRAQRDNVSQDTINKGTENSRLVAAIDNVKASTTQIMAAASELGVREEVHRATIEKAMQEIKESYAREDLTRVRAVLEKLNIAEARAMEKFFKSDIGEEAGFGRAIGTILKAIVGSVGRK